MMPERDDISQIIETETAHAISDALSKKSSDVKQLIAMVFTVVSMVAGVILWATNSHANIKDWTAEQDFVTKSELTEVMKEQYVKREDFVIVKEKLENLNKNHDKLLETLEKMDKKLDRMDSITTVRGRRTR